MKKNRLFLLVVLLSACAKEQGSVAESQPVDYEKLTTLTADEFRALTAQKSSFAITEEQAVENFLNWNLASPNTKGYNPSETDRVTKVSTQTVSVNTMSKSGAKRENVNLYVLEIERGSGENGFSLVSGDERLPEVLADVERGSLADTAINPNFNFYINCLLPEFIQIELADFQLNADTLLEPTLEKLQAMGVSTTLPDRRSSAPQTKGYNPLPGETYTEFYETQEIEHDYQCKLYTTWNQEYPYNNLMPLLSCTISGRAYAGCVQVAIAQIMAYHRRPSSTIGSYSIDWNQMLTNPYGYYLSSTGQNMVASLFKVLFDQITTSYDCSGTGSNVNKARDFYVAHGYTCDNPQAMNVSKVQSSLGNNRPVQIGGVDPIKDEGHSFVIDACREYVTYYNWKTYYHSMDPFDDENYSILTIVASRNNQFHLNMGLGGLDDGTYLFLPNSGYFSGLKYTNNLMVITNIRPI